MKKVNKLIISLGLSVAAISAFAGTSGGYLKFSLVQGGNAPQYALSGLQSTGEAFSNALTASGNQVTSSRPINLAINNSTFEAKVALPNPSPDLASTNEVVGLLAVKTNASKLEVQFEPVGSDYSCAAFNQVLSPKREGNSYVFNPAISCSTDAPAIRNYTYVLNVKPVKVVGASFNPQSLSLTSGAKWASDARVDNGKESNAYNLTFSADARNYNHESGDFVIAANTEMSPNSGAKEDASSPIIPITISKTSSSGAPFLQEKNFTVNYQVNHYRCKTIKQTGILTGDRTYTIHVATKCSAK